MSIHWAQVFGAAGLGGFRLLPADGHVVTVCDCAACRFAGGAGILARDRAELGIRAGETTADGAFTLETRPTSAPAPSARRSASTPWSTARSTAEKALHIVGERRAAAARVATAS